jgi:hypothetical protein
VPQLQHYRVLKRMLVSSCAPVWISYPIDVNLSRFAEGSSAAETAFELNKCLYSADPEVRAKFKLGTVNPTPKHHGALKCP